MKTITLTEDAYIRLLSWKESTRESFSKVVMKVVPAKYGGSEILKAAQNMPRLSEEQAKTIAGKVREGNTWKANEDAWTTSSTPRS